MCGICGLVLPFELGASELAALADATASLYHRGPDDGGVAPLGCCGLGHRRLAVVDLEGGAQPATNERGDVVTVLNGEIYNFRELRRELVAKGHEIPGTGDTAILPHLYEEYGAHFVKRLHGMFALALWDARERLLVLARDRIGKKPLLFAELAGGGLAFASELKALLRLPGIERQLDLNALDAFLALQYVPAPLTALRGVQKLLPAHVLVAKRGRIRIEQYWAPAVDPKVRSDDEWLELVRGSVRDAVRRRLVSDVPVGALLSGGIDSAVVVAMMADSSPEPVRTFSVGFDESRYDERAYARSVAQLYGTRHEEIVLRPDIGQTFVELTTAIDEPLGDPAILPLYLICRAASERVTVALTGDGGDEAFAGYDRYRAYAASNLLDRVPSPVLSAAARCVALLPGGKTEPRSAAYRGARFLRAVAVPATARYACLVELFSSELREDLLRGALHRATEEWLPLSDGRDLTALQLVDMRSNLPGVLLPKSDLTSMANSLELRSPLLDHTVLELGLSLPDRLKISRRRGKIALRSAFAPLLPPVVASRRKSGFLVPLSQWFRQDLRALAHDLLLDERARSRGLFQPAVVERILAEHVSGRADHAQRLWSLVVLESWLRRYLDGDALHHLADGAVAAL